MKKVIGRAKLDYDELLTMVMEVEMIINSCPLSYITSDDLEEPLTPAHFLISKRTMSIPDGVSGDQDWDDDIQITIPELSRQMRHLNSVLNTSGNGGRESIFLSCGNPTVMDLLKLRPL